MAYGSARYSAYQKKNKGVIVSEVQSSQYGQKNTGSTLGYVGGNFAAGLGGIVEGLSDLFVATGSLITGDVDYAKYVFKDNVVGDWHESLTEDYNPGKVMQFLGDVSHGLGQSSVFLLDAVGVPVGTVGFFGGMIGQGISGAAEKTGDVGFKEVAYGALSGAAEGALEKAMGGMSKLAGNLSSSVVKNTTKTAVRKGLFRQVLSDAASEFGEEFLSEYVDVALQRVTGVDKQASTTLKDAIYSGFVGAVSGAVSAGAGDIARYTANQRNGAKIIKSGNAQTLINTATAVADKLAASGTEFKKTAEWVKALRAEVDAYNKLTPEAQQGARGQTILGEMQASLYFAETQAVFNGVQVGIQNADEEKRAALAEYVNLTVDKSKRSKDYTAEDVAKNTDNIAWQLSVLHYANHIADLDAVMAQEEAVQGLIKEEQGAETAVPEAAQNVPQTAQGDVKPNDTVPSSSTPLAGDGSAEVLTLEKAESVVVDLGDGETLTFREAKQPLPTHEEKIARAKERAEKWKSFEEKTGATAQEMNKARSYVKNFDELENRNRLAILQTIRSAERSGTKVDQLTVRGIANVMAARTAKGKSFTGDLEVRFADGISQSGLYTHADGKPVIVINAKADSKEALRSTVAHELVHYLETRAGYNSLAAYVWQTARAEKKDAIRKEYEDFYKENEIEYSEEDIHSEIVARLVGERLQSEKFLKRYAEKDASMIKRAAGFMKGLRKATKDTDEEAERITGEIMLRMDRALAGADVRESDGGKKYSAGANYDFTKPFYQQVEDYINGKFPTGDSLILGATPEVFQKIGFNALPMTINQKHVDYALNGTKNSDHEIGEILLKYLPAALEHPVAIITSKTGSATSVVVIISVTHNGKQINVPVYVDGTAKQYGIYIDSNAVTSVYARNNAITTLLKNALDDESNGNIGLFYWNKKRAVALLSREKVTMPNVVNALSDGYIHSIRETGSSVKPKLQNVTESQQFKRWFGKSKVINSDGTPKILYHQTAEDFTVFDPRHKGAGTNDDETPFGIFMKPTDNDIGLKGKKQMVLYARIVNPLVVNDRADLVHTLKSLSSKYAELTKQRDTLSVEYKTKLENAAKAWNDYAKEYRLSHPDATRSEIYNDAEFQKLYDAEDILTEEWIEKADALSLQMKEEITKTLKDNNYDGVILKNDVGSGGRKVETYIALDSTQVKSATDNIGTFDKNTKDIRYDLKKKKAEGKEEVSEPFKNAVARMYEKDAKQAQNTAEAYKEANKVLSAKIEAERERYNRLYDAAIELQDRITFLERKTEAYAEGLNSKGELLQEARKKFREAVFRLEEKEDDLKRTGYELEAFKSGNRALNRKLAEERETNKELRQTNKSLARQIAQDAYEEDAKTFTQKEVDELIGRINSYSTEKFKDIMNEKSATLSKADKEQFAFDIYVAFHVASADSRAKERIGILADRLARQYLDNVYYTEDGGGRLYFKDIVDEAGYKGYVKLFQKKIMASFESMGRETTHARLTAAYRAEMAKLQKQLLDAEAKGKNLRELQYHAKKLKTEVDIQKRSPQDEGIYNVEKEMSRIADERGRISAKQADKAFDQMHVFLTSDSGKVDSALEELAQVEGESLISLIEEYKHSREKSKSKYLSSSEMALAAKIIAGGRKILREYNRVFYNGHWEDMGKLATESVIDLKAFAGADKEYKTKVGKWLKEKVGKTIQQTYFYNVLSPETVVEALEGYKKNGVLKTLYHAVREATQKAEHMAVQMKKPFAEYLDDKENAWTDEDGKKHSFRDKLNDKTVVVNGNEITLGEAIYLYMLMKREHSHLGLKESGFVTYDENNQSKLQFKILDIDAAMGQIDNQLDSTDKAFLKMAETFFNETASKIKYDADMKILGYTNNQEGYYVPIIRDRYERMANVTDKRQSIGSIATVYNKSFTQNLVKNQKALEGKNIMAIINDHADGLADYSELYLPLKSFDRVYNTRVITDTAQATSIRKVLNNEVWKGTDKYFKKLFADIQGQGEARDTLDQVVGKLRSGWVNSVLGLNLKVVATQTTSFVAANQVIEMKYLAPALQKFVGDVSELGARADEYSDIIEARSFEMGALRAQGNIDKVAKWSEKSGFMINWMDRRVCLAIFHAAELKAEAEGAGAVGTVENAQAAAKIADEVIYTTQAMTSQAERSALQRHKSEIAKMFAMFTSDSVKQLSHFYGNVMKYVAHKERAKTDATYEAELKKDAKAMGRSATTLVATGVMLGIITQAFKYLYAKEEEEPEEKAKDFAIDMISSTFNILPVVSDVMDKFVFGYDLSLNVLDIANDTIEDTSKLFSMAGKAMSGEFVSNADVGKNVIGAVKTYATLGGIPIAPVERTITGLLRRFSPSTVYGYDAMFSNPAYTSDLKDAVENGNERLAEHILERLYRSEATGVYNSAELEEVARLYSAGYENVLPQKVGESVNGVKLTRAQRRQFNSIYAGSSAAVERMMATEAFAVLTDEQKAKAIKNLYSLYYNRASAEVAGAEWSNAQAYSHLTSDMGTLFVAQAYKAGTEAYVDSSGREITVRDQIAAYVKNLGLSESDEIVMLYALGYRDKTTKASMLSYINSLSLTDEEKAKIAEKLGFDIVNGAVSLKVE